MQSFVSNHKLSPAKFIFGVNYIWNLKYNFMLLVYFKLLNLLKYNMKITVDNYLVCH